MPTKGKSVAGGSPTQAPNPTFQGLVLHGKCVGRTKQEFVNDKTGEVRTKINYLIDVGKARIACEDWDAPKEELIGVEDQVALSVDVRAYVGKNNQPRYALSVRRDRMAGQVF